jgi:hypothetical protein
MDAIKSFFAKDWVKIVAGGIYVVLNVLLVTVMPEGPTKTTLLTIWNAIIAPMAVYFGITSGGTSSQVSDATKTVRTELVQKGVVAPVVGTAKDL